MTLAMETVLDDIAEERGRQDAKWGTQRDHPDGTGIKYVPQANHLRWLCDQHFKEGRGTWTDILLEEVYEALSETDLVKLRAELIQIAAVACCWVEALDTRQP